jgi:SAM-dependent methyltransferase
MGFTEVYKHLAQIIPKGRIVVDLGCGYGAQAFYFRHHKQYIAVDLTIHAVLPNHNFKYCMMSIKEWIDKELPKYHIEDLFAICNFVPPWNDDNEQLVRDNFKYLFINYASNCDFKK